MADIRTDQFAVEYALPTYVTARVDQFPIEYAVGGQIPVRIDQFVIEYLAGRNTDQSCPVDNAFGVSAPGDAACAVPDEFGVE